MLEVAPCPFQFFVNRLLFGYENHRAQGGTKDQCLVFDFPSVDEALPVRLEGKQPCTGTDFVVYDAMAQCATVACVVEMCVEQNPPR